MMEENGFIIERQPFACIDMRQGEIQFSASDRDFNAFISPYSLGCDIRAELVHATTAGQLEQMEIKGKLLLLSGEIAAEQLMPKNYVFYNPESHQRVHRLLEKKSPRRSSPLLDAIRNWRAECTPSRCSRTATLVSRLPS